MITSLLFNINMFMFKFSFFRNKIHQYIYLYNKNYFVVIKFSKKTKLVLINSNKLSIKYSINYSKKLQKDIDYFLMQFNLSKFTKIKFSGKGYKIKKNSINSIVLLFNRAHITKLWWRNIILRKLKKYKIYLNYMNSNKGVINNILRIRSCNIFTKKGLRKSRQIILKKKGKK